MTKKLTNRQRAMSALIARSGAEEAAKLCEVMSDEDRESCLELIELYQAKGAEAMEGLVRNLVASEGFSTIAEVHPAWILDKLRHESPRVIGIILRFLPSRHVRYVLKNLEPIVCKQVPEMVESFSVDPAVIEVIRRRFESMFVPMRVSRSIEAIGFENLYYLSAVELDEVIKELGIVEMALALTELPKSAIKIVYNRLDVRDAKRLKSRLDDAQFASPELKRSARASLLQIDSERPGSERALRRLGLSFLSGAVLRGDEEVVSLAMQKMDPSDGYLLKRLIDEKLSISSASALADTRRELVLKLIASLAKEGRLDGAWSAFWPEEPEAREVSAAEASPTVEDAEGEETKTFSIHDSHQLA